MFGYLRRIGLPLFLLGMGIALMTGAPTSWFWIGTAAFYVGIIFLAIDVWQERFFQRLALLLRIAVGALYAGAVLLFTWLWIFAPAPLVTTSETRLPNYPPGAIVGGISWEDHFSELIVHIKNETDKDYSNLILRVETDLGIDQLRPQQAWFNCSSFPDTPPLSAPRVTHIWKDDEGTWHKQGGIPSTNPDMPAWAYRVVCDKFPHDSELDLIGAMSNYNLYPTAPVIGSPLFLPPKAARWVKIAVTYAFRHSHTVERTDCFSGQLGRSMTVGDCADSLGAPESVQA